MTTASLRQASAAGHSTLARVQKPAQAPMFTSYAAANLADLLPNALRAGFELGSVNENER